MILMGMVKHSQSSQNSKFKMSLQYLKKEDIDELDFLHADKHHWHYRFSWNRPDMSKVTKISLKG